jgi:hypothetical protein
MRSIYTVNCTLFLLHHLHKRVGPVSQSQQYGSSAGRSEVKAFVGFFLQVDHHENYATNKGKILELS